MDFSHQFRVLVDFSEEVTNGGVCSTQGKLQKQSPLGEKSLGEFTGLRRKRLLSEEGGERERAWRQVEARLEVRRRGRCAVSLGSCQGKAGKGPVFTKRDVDSPTDLRL